MIIQATALVHEAWLRLRRERKGWENVRSSSRQRASAKRGGSAHHAELSESSIAVQVPDEETRAVHDALEMPLRSGERLWTFSPAPVWVGDSRTRRSRKGSMAREWEQGTGSGLCSLA